MNSKRLLFFHYSNQLESLFQQLVFELKNLRPFEKVWIVVPSLAVKNYLKNKLAHALGICMHIEFLWIQQAAYDAIRLSYPNVTMETQVHLALKIQLKVRELIEADFLQPLRTYLGWDERSEISEQKLVSVCDSLASQFIIYSLYVPDFKEQFSQTFSEHWQKKIWDAVFEETKSFNAEPNQILEQSIEPQKDPHKIFFFNISFMPKPFFKLFDRLQQQFSMTFLQLSPCLFYWSDIYTDMERVRLVSKLKKKNNSLGQVAELEEYLLDVNPLLANLSKLGKNWVKQIESIETESAESYVVAQAVAKHPTYQDWMNPHQLSLVDKPLTLLRAIQADLLLMRTGQDKVALEEVESIQIHQTSSYQREVEVLYQNLIALLHQRADLKPRDVIVYIANIEAYIPIIESIFNDPSSPLEALIYNGSIAVKNKALKALYTLLELSQSHFDQAKLFEFFYQPAFYQRFNITLETVQLWHAWLEEIGPCLGFDSKDQDLYFKKQYHQEVQTKDRITLHWQECIETFLKYLCRFYQESDWLPHLSALDLSQSEELNLLVSILTSLKKDLDILTTHQMTFVDWSNYLNCLFDSYYRFDDRYQKEAEFILNVIHSFQKKYLDFGNELFNFQTYYYYLKKELADLQPLSSQNQQEAIAFYSIFHSSPAPAKVSCLLGFSDSVIPRAPQVNPLSLLSAFKNRDYYPQLMDYDRYLFLEVLLTTSEYLWISYLGNCPETFKKMQPSILISELLSYLDGHFEIKGQKPSSEIIFEHPHFNFNKKYFVSKNFQTKNYPLAQAFYQKEKVTPLSKEFIWGNPRSISSKIPKIKEISLQQLAALAKDPIGFALKNFHQIYLKFKDGRHLNQHYALGDLQKTILKKHLFADHFLTNKNELPRGIFQTIAKNQLQEEQKDIFSLLASKDLKNRDLFSVELRSDVQQAHFFEDRIWVCPTLKISLSSCQTIEINGILEGVSKQGLLSMSTFSLETMLSDLPKYLVYLSLTNLIPLDFQPQWIFLKSKKIKRITLENPQKYLELYLQLYFLNSNQILPFLPEWIPFFLQDEPQEILRKIDANMNAEHFYHPYVKKVMNKMPISIQLVKEWKNLATAMFTQLIGDLKNEEL